LLHTKIVHFLLALRYVCVGISHHRVSNTSVVSKQLNVGLRKLHQGRIKTLGARAKGSRVGVHRVQIRIRPNIRWI